MKKLIFLIKNTLNYYKINIIIASIVYLLSILVGIGLFYNEKIPISPKSLSFTELLYHNSISGLLIILSGFITFGILGNFILIANGIILGRIFIGVLNNYGITPILTNIAPHIIFETLAIFIATAISYEPYKLLYNIKHTNIKVIRLKYCLFGLFLVVVLLIFSALIESSL